MTTVVIVLVVVLVLLGGVAVLRTRRKGAKPRPAGLLGAERDDLDAVEDLVALVEAEAPHERAVYAAVREPLHDARQGDAEALERVRAGLADVLAVARLSPALQESERFAELRARLPR